MIKIANQKIIRSLTLKSLKADRARNLIAITAIALTATLFTTLFTVSLGVLETFQHQMIRQSGGDGHAALKFITDEQYNAVKGHSLIRAISYNLIIAESMDNPEFLKHRVEMYYMDDTAMDLAACVPTTGRKPRLENEIIMDTQTLDALGVSHQIGASVPLDYTVHGQKVHKDFVLSGFWQSDPLFSVGYAIVSKAYLDGHRGELLDTHGHGQNSGVSGMINSYIMFKSSWNLPGQLRKAVTDSGFVLDDEKASNYIAGNINWAYLTSSKTGDPVALLALFAAAALIITTGYLIIFNIFHISVIRDIRFYGLLKTIGATGRQIRMIIRGHALILSATGIPAGLVLGFLTGQALVPLVVSVTSYSATIISTWHNARSITSLALIMPYP